ncbi:TonB family protein [Asticcacaulis sp. BYS171W]|uniref:Protein TonB n=1 Tax=Asticcacaulis aquaticus TaxID=2984212 RepID=A0ABT5HX17_9CAUL|nr:TonB family protein [Asticcacaulis aquaticus]
MRKVASPTRTGAPSTRKKTNAGLAWAIGISIGFHAAIAAYVITTQFVLPEYEQPETEAILVSMGPLPTPEEQPETPPPPLPPETKPLIQPRETPAPIFQDVPPLPLPPVKTELKPAPQSPPAPPEIAKGPPAPPAAAAGPKNDFVAVDVDSALTNNPPPPYPAQAKARREEGTVVLRLQVRGDGSVGEVQIKQSSGSMRLDNAAATAIQRWRFKPAMQGGKPVDSWATVPITFGFKKRDRGGPDRGGPDDRRPDDRGPPRGDDRGGPRGERRDDGGPDRGPRGDDRRNPDGRGDGRPS